VGRRINPGGVREIIIRPYGARQIEIIVPEADEAETQRMKKVISRIGTLEFRILATTYRQQYKWYMERAKALSENQFELRDDDNTLLAWWVPVAKGKEKESFNYSDIATRRVKRRGQDLLEVLVVKDQFDVNGGYLTRASVAESMGKPSVSFHFNDAGARRFSQLTGSHRPDSSQTDSVQDARYYLGIILDGYLHSAPYIKSVISDSGEISGDFTEEEVQELVDVLNAGSLPTALSPNPISEIFTGPTLGSDTIRMGRNSMILSMVLVCAFMLVYYRFSGIVACVALVINLVLLLACMIAIKAAFSLPGLAGFALTIGMAVDSNVLIYERFREEFDRGAALRMVVRNGFDRAFSAIFDSHLTTMISAAVLYMIGQEQIKGFAITLFLGVAINLYTAVFCVHVVFDVAERQKWISRLKMMRFLSKPNVDFWGIRYRCYTASIVVILIGLVGVFARGQGLLNIDFTGGVSVQIVFDKPQDIARIRDQLDEYRDRDLQVSDVKVEGEEVGRRFVINTSSPPGVEATDYLKRVQDSVKAAFPGELTTNGVTVSEVRPIAGASPTSKPPAKPETPPPGPAKEEARPPAKPESPPPAKQEAKPPAKSTPESKKQSRADLPAGTLLASTDPSAVWLAQAEKPAEKAAAETKPAEKSAAAATPPAVPTQPAPAPASQPAAPSTPASPAAAGGSRFSGGTEATLQFRQALRRDGLDQMIKAELDQRGEATRTVDFDLSNSQYIEGDTTAYSIWTVKINLPKDKAESLFTTIQEHLRNAPFFPSSNTIGGSVAGSTRVQAVYAIIVSNLLIMLYLWVRFQRLSYGVAAVVALIHDVLVTLGLLALTAWVAPVFDAIGLRFLMVDTFKIGMTEVAAFLTLVGFSVSDTVVIFDRIREVKGKTPQLTPQIINASINQTMSRTILTSLTAWLVVVVLYFLGGPTIHGFAFAMTIGVITGTYSSIYVAAPLLLVGKKHAAVKAEPERRKPGDRMSNSRWKSREPGSRS
jgi:SecD/SecF fusion protein